MKKRKIMLTTMLLFSLAIFSGCGDKKVATQEAVPTQETAEVAQAQTISGAVEEVNDAPQAVAITEDEYLEQFKDYHYVGSLYGKLTFSEGVAWVATACDYDDYIQPALVDENMNITYVCGIDKIKFYNFYPQVWPVKDGIAVASASTRMVTLDIEDERESAGFVFVDASGKEVYSNTEDKTCFLARANDGTMFFIQRKSGFSADGIYLNKITATGEVTELGMIANDLQGVIEDNMEVDVLSNGAYISHSEKNYTKLFYFDPAKQISV